MKLVSVNTGLPRESDAAWENGNYGDQQCNQSQSASLYTSSIWTATVWRTSASTAANTKLCTVTRSRTTR
jgi:hypothetical protein